jgi:hypothetical protein
VKNFNVYVKKTPEGGRKMGKRIEDTKIDVGF